MTKTLLAVGILTLAISVPGAAQGKGQGGGGPRGTQASQAQGQAKGRGGPDMGRGTTDRTRQRIHATDQQRDQLRTCDQAMDRIRQRARDLAQGAAGANFDPAQARQQQAQLREELRQMEQEHHRLMNGLNDDQRRAFEARHREMEQIRERIHARLQEMESELGQASPNKARVAEQARNVEREMKELQKQHRAMQTEMGVTP